MKIEIRGQISQIGEPREAGKSLVREIIISKKYFDSNTGELKGEDYYPVQIWEDVFPEFEKAYTKSSNMVILGYVNGRRAEKDGSVSHFLNITGKSFISL